MFANVFAEMKSREKAYSMLSSDRSKSKLNIVIQFDFVENLLQDANLVTNMKKRTSFKFWDN